MADKLKGKGGVIWAVRYVHPGTGLPKNKSVVNVLADEIDVWLDKWDDEGKDWNSEDLAHALLTGMNMGASGAGGVVAENEVVRRGVSIGVPMIARLDWMAEDAVLKARRADDEQTRTVARARARGLIQAITFIKSPTTWEAATNKKKVEMIKAEEQRINRVR